MSCVTMQKMLKCGISEIPIQPLCSIAVTFFDAAEHQGVLYFIRIHQLSNLPTCSPTTHPYLFLTDPQRTEYDALDHFGNQHEDTARSVHQNLRKTSGLPHHHSPAGIKESKGILKVCRCTNPNKQAVWDEIVQYTRDHISFTVRLLLFVEVYGGARGFICTWSFRLGQICVGT